MGRCDPGRHPHPGMHTGISGMPCATVISPILLGGFLPTESVMSQDLAPSSSSSSNFQSILNAALELYEKKTNNKLLTHPLAAQLQSCDSPAAILSVLQDLIQKFDQRRHNDERLANCLKPTVNVIYAFSSTLAQGVGLVFSPASVVFAGIGILLLAAKDVDASQDMLVDIFVRIENFFKRLESYTEVTPTVAMTDVIVKTMAEVLSIIATATKEIKQGRPKKFVKKLLGRNDIEDALKRLDSLTIEEARMAIAEILKVTNRVDNKVTDVTETTANLTESLQQENLREWLSPPDPSINHNIARKAYHKGTASWFFQGAFSESGSCLLLFCGSMASYSTPLTSVFIAGSGKSVLCSGIIEDIMTQREAGSAIVTYFYCDFRDEDKQNCRNLVLSIISQLCAQSSLCCDTLSRVYRAHDKGSRKPSDETLTKCLIEMLSHPVQSPIYLIVDALDECPNNSGLPTPREEVLELVKNLTSLRLPNLHICVTSRPEIDIQTILEPLTYLPVSLHNQ
ncbi:hypothetical protein BGY98DRAFT_936642, partial [Russula aff. rugulosa BPL654]